MEEELHLVRRWVEEVWNEGQWERLNDFHPPVFENHGRPSNAEEAWQWHAQMRVTYPDLHYHIDELFGCDRRVAMRWTATGTQQGDLWGMIPATHQRVQWSGMHILHVVDGKIAAVWAVADNVSMLRQLGATLQPKVA